MVFIISKTSATELYPPGDKILLNTRFEFDEEICEENENETNYLKSDEDSNVSSFAKDFICHGEKHCW